MEIFPLNTLFPPFIKSKFKFSHLISDNIYKIMKMSPNVNQNCQNEGKPKVLIQNQDIFHIQKLNNTLKVEENINKRNKRKNKSYSKWDEDDVKQFWLKNLQEMNKFPEKIHSWNNWKPDRYFHDMAKFVKTKTATQCKSFDQRMKNQFGGKSIDLPQATLISLQPYENEDPELKQKLQILKKTIEKGVILNLPEQQADEENSLEGNEKESLQFKNDKEKYIQTIKECVEYFKGEGQRKIDELIRKVHQ